MVISLVASILTVSVALVPKAAIPNNNKNEIQPEIEFGIPPEAKVIVKKNIKKAEKKEGVIELRKAKAPSTIKYVKNKKGKLIAVKAEPRTEFDNENLDGIYKKEQKYFKSASSEKPKKHKEVVVSGPLASIPAAVANSIASNIAAAKTLRTPAPAPIAVKPKAQSPEEFLNVEPAIQNPDRETRQELKKRSPASIDTGDLLTRVEKKYVSSFIKIKVNSEVTQALLERTSTYSGDLFLAPTGLFKLDIKEPNKHMLLMNGKNIWVVDYPLDGMQDKVQILHSNSAKALKNQAFLNIFSGVGSLQKRFKIERSSEKNDETTYKLIPKKKDEQIERVELKLDSQAELISVVTFWDSLGNKTQLKFSKQEFKDETPKEFFDFKPPKGAYITNL